jgi:hypothetical protein
MTWSHTTVLQDENRALKRYGFSKDANGGNSNLM